MKPSLPPVEYVTSICDWCHERFEHEHSPRHTNRPPKYCGEACRNQALRLASYPLAGTAFPEPDWADHASCHPSNTPQHLAPSEWTDMWFLGDVTPSREGDSMEYRYAHQRCEGCPVRVSCLNYALNNSIQNGIYGGLTSHRRRRIRRTTNNR